MRPRLNCEVRKSIFQRWNLWEISSDRPPSPKITIKKEENTSKQRAFLNSQAHTLKPIIQIGKNGLNDQIKTSVRQALDARELIKVTLLQNTDENIHEVAEILEEEIGVDTVQKIGRILILYKQSSKKENRKISKKVKEI